MVRAPSEPPKTATSLRPSSTPRAARASARPAERSTSSTSVRTGLPVQVARGRSVASKAVAAAAANRLRTRLARPGTAFCSVSTTGTRSRAAANPQAAEA